MKTKAIECGLYCARYVKGVSRVTAARLALWAALLFIVLVAGMAVLGHA